MATGMSVQLSAHFCVQMPSSLSTTVRSSWPTATFPSARGATKGSSCFPVGKSSLIDPFPSTCRKTWGESASTSQKEACTQPRKTCTKPKPEKPIMLLVWLERIWFSLWPSFPQCKSSFQNGENHLPGTNRATVQSNWGFYRCEVLQYRISLLVGMKMVQPAYILAFHRAKHKPTTGASNTTSRYYCPWEIKLYICTNSHIQTLIAAFFRVAKNGEQVYPSADRWINKLQSIHGTEYFGCERQQPLTYAHRWISNVLCYVDLHLKQFYKT